MKVYLIAEPQINLDSLDSFARDEEVFIRRPDLEFDSEYLVEQCGRICYMSYGKGRKTTADFIKNIIDSGHHSVLEHANFTVFITGISRACSHELVRHRHLSYSQLSQRYVDESEAGVITPTALTETGITDVFTRAVDTAKTAYKILVSNLEIAYAHIENTTLRRKAARQAARMVLPNATETKIAVTGNVRAWRHFIDMRASVHADPEIRALAVEVHRVLVAAAPLLFGDMEVSV